MIYFIIALMPILYALAGGSFPYSFLLDRKDKGGIMPVSLTWLPEALLSISLAYVAVTAWSVPAWAGLLFGGWFYGWIQAGHKDMLDWDYDDGENRDNTLSPIGLFIAGKFGIDRNSEAYAWLFAALKGFIITLPIGGLGIVTLPLAHEIGSHARGRVYFDPHLVVELLGGLGFALCSLFILWVL